jgi:hypothetical protein
MDVQVRLVCLVRLICLQTDNFWLFLHQQTDKRQTSVCVMSERAGLTLFHMGSILIN